MSGIKFFIQFFVLSVILFTACKKTADIVVVVPPPTDSKSLTLSGGAGGANAVNSVLCGHE